MFWELIQSVIKHTIGTYKRNFETQGIRKPQQAKQYFMKKYTSIDEYIADFSPVHQERMVDLRAIIHSVASQTTETIAYNMPAFKQNGIVAYFAANKNHIGFYPTSSGIRNFEHKFGNLKYSKGALHFPLDQPLPEELIVEIVKFRLEEDFLKKKI